MTIRSSWLSTPSGLPRARALDVPFVGKPGQNNAITDVPGVEVGYRTMIRDDGEHAVRTGVTAIHPRGRARAGEPVFAGVHSLNGNGEMTGFVWVEECGRTELPITITNTHAVGLCRDATIKWIRARRPSHAPEWGLPICAETFDGTLNDVNGFHVTDDDVFAALDDARSGPLDEGSVGGGTGMVCYEWKGGSGTASRVVAVGEGEGTVGAFVQANFGRRELCTIAGVPIGRLHPVSSSTAHDDGARGEAGSIIAVIATDIPLLPHQLKRLAQRCGLGVAKSGGYAAHGSGDIFVAFSTGNAAFLADKAPAGSAARALEAVPDDALSPVLHAVAQAVDEAIMNALSANADMRGRGGVVVPAMPKDAVRASMARWREMVEAQGPFSRM